MSYQTLHRFAPMLTKGTCVSPHISHKFLIVDTPIVAIVKRPTHLQLTVRPRPRPVNVSQKYHQNRKGLCATGGNGKFVVFKLLRNSILHMPVLLIVKIDPYKRCSCGE